MDYSDYLDIEILASRKGILPSQELARREKNRQKRDKENERKRQERFHEAHKGYRTEQSRRFREKHPGYYTNSNNDRSEYYRRYYQSRKENINRLCRTCKYSVLAGQGSRKVMCYYVVIKQELRVPWGSGIGWCDKYEKGTRKKGFT